MTFRCGSLFSGIGGFDRGLELAGMEVVWQVEYDEQAQSVLRHHWPNVEPHKDVTDVGRADLAPVDLICGGFPCQDLSVAGRRAGLAGERSGLFYEFMRIVDEIAPRWVLIENVPGLLSSHDGRDMGAVLGTLGDLGYGFVYRVLDTQYFGPPQRRRRVFISEGHDASEDGTGRGVPLALALRGREGGSAAELGGETAHALRSSQGGGDKPHVLTAVPQRLTPTECERLQGFPDDWTRHGRTPDGETVELADSPRYRMLGNAVSVPVAHWIGNRIMEAHSGLARRVCGS